MDAGWVLAGAVLLAAFCGLALALGGWTARHGAGAPSPWLAGTLGPQPPGLHRPARLVPWGRVLLLRQPRRRLVALRPPAGWVPPEPGPAEPGEPGPTAVDHALEPASGLRTGWEVDLDDGNGPWELYAHGGTPEVHATLAAALGGAPRRPAALLWLLLPLRTTTLAGAFAVLAAVIHLLAGLGPSWPATVLWTDPEGVRCDIAWRQDGHALDGSVDCPLDGTSAGDVRELVRLPLTGDLLLTSASGWSAPVVSAAVAAALLGVLALGLTGWRLVAGRHRGSLFPVPRGRTARRTLRRQSWAQLATRLWETEGLTPGPHPGRTPVSRARHLVRRARLRLQLGPPPTEQAWQVAVDHLRLGGTERWSVVALLRAGEPVWLVDVEGVPVPQGRAEVRGDLQDGARVDLVVDGLLHRGLGPLVDVDDNRLRADLRRDLIEEIIRRRRAVTHRRRTAVDGVAAPAGRSQVP